MKIVKRYCKGGKVKKYKKGGFGQSEFVASGQAGNVGGMAAGVGDAIFSTIPDDNISEGGKKAASISQTTGSALMASGFPPAMIAGAALKAVTGLATLWKQKKDESDDDPLKDKVLSLTTQNTTSNALGLKRKGGFVYKKGGKFTEKGGIPIKQYNGPTHEQGGIGIDSLMNPIDYYVQGGPIPAQGEVEKKEVAFDIKDLGKYILSDDPSMIGSYGHTPARVASKTLKRLPGESAIDVKTTELLMKNLASESEAIKPPEPKPLFRFGGEVPMFKKGDKFKPIPMEVSTQTGPMDITNLNEDKLFGAPGYDTWENVFNQSEAAKAGILPTENNYALAFFRDIGIDKQLEKNSSMNDYTSDINKEVVKSRDFVIRNKDKEKEKRKKIKDNTNDTDKADIAKIFGSALKGSALADQLKQLLEPAQRTDTVGNPLGDEAIADLSRLSIDMSPVKNEIRLASNAQRKSNRSVDSFAVQQALDQNTYDREIEALAKTAVDAQAQNNQYKAMTAEAKLTKGEADRQDRVRAQTANEMNQAAKAQMRDAFRQSLNSAADAALLSGVTKKRTNEMTSLLNSRYADFGISHPDTWGKNKDVIIAKMSKMYDEGYNIEEILEEMAKTHSEITGK